MTNDHLLSRIRELEDENQRLREALEHKDKLLDQAVQGLAEFNKMVFPSVEQKND